jgi:hypothetical protein
MKCLNPLRLGLAGATVSLLTAVAPATAHDHGETYNLLAQESHRAHFMSCDSATQDCNDFMSLMQAQAQSVSATINFGHSELWGNLAGVSATMPLTTSDGSIDGEAFMLEFAGKLQDDFGITEAEANQMRYIMRNHCMPQIGAAGQRTMNQCPLSFDVHIQMTNQRDVSMKFDFNHPMVQFDMSAAGMAQPVMIYRGSFDDMMARFGA